MAETRLVAVEGLPGTLGARPESFVQQALTSQELFRSVDMSNVAPLLRNCPVRSLVDGETLISAGRVNNNLYLLLDGGLSVRLKSADTVPVAHIKPGESVGEVSLVDGQPTSAFVISEGDSHVLVIDDDLLWMLANTSHAVSTNLLFTLVKRLRFGNEVIFHDRERLEQYRFHATVDALTGLFNRHWLNKMLLRHMKRACNAHEPLSLLMVDIDRFKDYNDSHGHVAGDQAICVVAGCLQDSIRPSDIAARYGGEEFVVVLPSCSLESAAIVAERLRRAVSESSISYSHGEPLPSVTISVGGAEMPEGSTLEGFIAAADAALYRAKKSGRNRYSV